jgi:hypothetical protein
LRILAIGTHFKVGLLLAKNGKHKDTNYWGLFIADLLKNPDNYGGVTEEDLEFMKNVIKVAITSVSPQF